MFSSDETTINSYAPLADVLRPSTLDEIVGQGHILGPDKILRQLINSDRLPSMILWGPPGSGKTTLARVLAQHAEYYFVELSAVMSGVADLKVVVKEAQARQQMYQRGTIVFIDEIHRFNKAQQDAILPHIERGTFTLIGATTENPGFSVNRALLSRCKTFILEQLSIEDLNQVVDRAIEYYQQQHNLTLSVTDEAATFLIRYSDGDARRLLTAIETVVVSQGSSGHEILLDLEGIRAALQVKYLPYDRNGEEHYNLISALHKSVRDSDADASVYWLARILEGGEDPMYVARRLVRMAVEDVGLADPQALILAQSAMAATYQIGMPESSVILAEVAIYLALAPKSNSAYGAYLKAKEATHNTINQPVPLHLRNAANDFMKSVGYGQGYRYAHDAPNAQVDQQHLPDSLKNSTFYTPTPRGWEGAETNSTHKQATHGKSKK